MPIAPRSMGDGSRRRRARWLAIAIAALGVPGLAQARCALSSFGFVAQDVRMDMGTVVIRPDVPIGSVIQRLEVPIDARSSIARCDRSGGTAYGAYVNAAQQIPVPGMADVYATDVAGVGIRLFRDSGSVQTYYPHTLSFRPYATLSLTGGRFIIELIKTAEQTGSGPLAPAGRFTTYYLDGDGAGRPILTSSFSGAGTTLVSPTCEVEAGNRNIAVDFGSVPAASFAGVGTRAVNRDFAIRLNCRGSQMAEFQSAIGVRLQGAQDPSDLPGVLRIAEGDEAASRIGIELVDMRTGVEAPLTLGQKLEIGRTAPTPALLSLPLRARYIQTRPGTVGPGRASGVATFTIEYD